MKQYSLFILASLAAALAAAPAYSSAVSPLHTAKTDKGVSYVDARGQTLYTFDKDDKGHSNCNEKCALNWPPMKASTNAKAQGDWTIIKREDGTRQWAYKDKPLYRWAKETKRGMAGADGVGDAWHIAKP